MLRNKIEHDFKKPKIDDLETLFDLITALISLLQSAMSNQFFHEIELSVLDNSMENVIGSFSMELDLDSQTIKANWGERPHYVGNCELIATLKEPKEFAYFFKILILLNTYESYSNIEHVIKKIKSGP